MEIVDTQVLYINTYGCFLIFRTKNVKSILQKWNSGHMFISTQGRVQVVMNPCKYEIPSGSTYGYVIADDAEQVTHLLCPSQNFIQQTFWGEFVEYL